MFSFSNIYAKICFSALTAVTQTCLVIHLFLSHKSTCV